MEIALHGSYTSLAAHRLLTEVERLARIGFTAEGVRQHWLRFAGDNLFEQVENAGLSYDSTVGFSERIGFRAGACFPYPPYNFRCERAYAFLEIPLAIMDVALHLHVRDSKMQPQALCNRVISMTEAFGWGGVDVLWHNTVFGGAQLPAKIGPLYWALKDASQKWVANSEIVEAIRPRLRLAFGDNF